ncbi:methyltransferase [Mycobacterium phage Indlulamithi]|uniref:Uncharacterized protein n=1 Tax=Mycobacterium phage Indlulamithi TaxID=2656582 RepID=A0A649VCP8_9CAUD|nr:methyltransferase [Mycobacterium phage Indlulamithi]QGJ90108.1 hypothetical protein PBI_INDLULAMITHI_70 [Mycobacterium phage Indlulamithi]
MPVIKPKNDLRNEESGVYSGPLPKAGPYKGVVNGMWYNTIKKGDNAGEDQYTVSVKITEGQYKGFTTLHNLPQLKQNGWSTNQFLDAMTDGSEKQRKLLRDWFYDNGCDVAPDDEANKIGVPVRKILSPKGPKAKGFTPVGKEIGFILKKDNYGDQERMIVDRFVLNVNDPEPEQESDDDNLGAPEDDSTPDDSTPDTDAAEDDSTEDVDTEDSPPSEDGDGDDDDDPWS